MTKMNENRLQLLHARFSENKIEFPSIDSLKTHILQRYDVDSRFAEPFVAYYASEDGVRMVLCIANKDSKNNIDGIEPYTMIDVTSIESSIKEMGKNIGSIPEQFKKVEDAIKTIKATVEKEKEEREQADATEKTDRERADQLEKDERINADNTEKSEREKANAKEKNEREQVDAQIASATGLVLDKDSNKYKYVVDIHDDVLRDATSVNNAINTLSKFVQDSNIAYKFEDTPTVKFETTTADKVTTVKSDVVLSLEDGDAIAKDDDNILVKRSDGLAAYIGLQYKEEKEGDKLRKGLVFTKSSTKINADDKNRSHTSTFIELPIPKIEVEQIKGSLAYKIIVDGNVIGTIDIPKDQFIKQFTYNSKTKILQLLYAVQEGDKDGILEIPLTDLIDEYTAGNGLQRESNEFSIKRNPQSEGFLVVDESGVCVTGVQDAINTAKNESVKSANEYTDSVITASEKRLIGNESDGVSALTIHGVSAKASDSLDKAKKYTDTEIAEVTKLVNNGDAKLTGNGNDTSDKLTIYGTRALIEEKKTAINRLVEDTKGDIVGTSDDSSAKNTIFGAKQFAKDEIDSLSSTLNTSIGAYASEAKKHTDTEISKVSQSISNLKGNEDDGPNELTVSGVSNKVNAVKTELTSAYKAADSQTLADAKSYIDEKNLALTGLLNTERSERTNSDNDINARLNTIEGTGDGSIKKAVSDKSAEVEESIKKALTTEENARTASINAAVSGLVDNASTDFNTLSKIESIVNQERQDRIAGDKKVALKVVDTETVNMTLTPNDETGNEIKADIRVSDMPNNILRADGKGLFVPNIYLAYDAPTNKLKFTSNGKTEEIQLSGIKGIDNINYDPRKQELVFTIVNNEGRAVQTPVSLKDLIPTPKGTSDGVITIQTETVPDGTGKLINNISATFHGGIKDVDGLEAALGKKSDVGHKHGISDVNGLNESLLGKAAKEHTHSASGVIGKFVATYAKNSNGSLVPESTTFETVDLVIQHILTMLATVIQDAGGIARDVKEVKENITKLSDKVNQNSATIASNKADIANVRAEMTTADSKVLDDAKKYSDKQIEKIDGKIDKVVEQIGTGNGEGITYTVYNKDTQKYEAKQFKLVGAKNADGSDRVTINFDEKSGVITIDVANIDLGTYGTTPQE